MWWGEINTETVCSIKFQLMKYNINILHLCNVSHARRDFQPSIVHMIKKGKYPLRRREIFNIMSCFV